MTKDLFKLIEKIFLDLLSIVESVFSKSEISEVQEYIDFGEYGLALDTFIDILIEEDKIISPRVVPVLEKLIRLMELDKLYVARISDRLASK